MQRSAFIVSSLSVDIDTVEGLQCVVLCIGMVGDTIAMVAAFAVDSLADFLVGNPVNSKPEGASVLFTRESGFLRYEDESEGISQSAFFPVEMNVELLRMLEEVRAELGL